LFWPLRTGGPVHNRKSILIPAQNTIKLAYNQYFGQALGRKAAVVPSRLERALKGLTQRFYSASPSMMAQPLTSICLFV
jgi:hypothetical protein